MTATNAAVATAALETRGLSKTFGHGDLAVTAVRAVDSPSPLARSSSSMGRPAQARPPCCSCSERSASQPPGRSSSTATTSGRFPERRGPSLRARHFGFVFQDFNLLGALSAAENVTLAGITGRDARQLATTALERVGLGHRTNFRPD